MIEFLIYDLKVAVLIAVFYMFYRLMLSKETFHRVNRIVLLATAVVSFVLPLCVITMHETMVMPAPMSRIDVELGTAAAIADEASQVSLWQKALPILFIIGMVATMANTLWSVFRILALIRKSEQHPQDDGTTICVTGNAALAPFSWMHYIVMNRSDYETQDAAILAHERGHIRLHHSWDVLLVDLLTALQWFNPAIWMLRSDLRAIHEYEADGAVLSQGINARQYQYLLITKAGGIGGYSLANGITHSALKNRITMMLHKESPRRRLLKLLALLPIVGVTLALNAETVTDVIYKNDKPQKQVPVKKGKKNATIKTSSGQTITVVKDDESTIETTMVADTETFFIKGKVLDGSEAEHTPIPGAIVKVAGSKNGTVTDRDGYFRLEVSVGDHIEAMYVGYDTYTIGVSKAYAQFQDYVIMLNKEGASPDNSRPFDVVEHMPKFPGGTQALMEFLSKNIRYPKDAAMAGIQGRVIATFIVEKDGSITEPKVVKPVSPSLDAEALRVVTAMPNWEPGTQNGEPVRVKYTIPITFRLDGKDAPKGESKVHVVGQAPLEQQPLIVLDGEPITREAMEKLDPKSIAHMEVLKDASATKLYGDKAKNGAIVITTKK